MANEVIGFGEAKAADQIATKVFEQEFKQLKDRLEKQESLSQNIIFGSLVVVVITVAGLIWGAWTFIGEYNQHYLDTEAEFQKEIGDFKKGKF